MHQQITTLSRKIAGVKCSSPWKKKMFNFWINIQLWGVNLFFRYWYYVNCWIWSSWFKFFWSLLSVSNHSCGYWSSCGPDNLPLHGPCSMHPTSCHWEKIYCFLSSSHFGFPGIHACKYFLCCFDFLLYLLRAWASVQWQRKKEIFKEVIT